MTHRVHPYIFRIGTTATWKSRWFDRRRFAFYLRQDTLLRQWLEKKLQNCHIDQIEFERSPGIYHVIVKTARPGMVIGRGGEGAERLRKEIKSVMARIAKRRRQEKRGLAAGKRREENVEVPELKLTIEEVASPEGHAAIAARMIVEDIEKRLPFRRVLKQALEKISSSKDVKGVKISLKGRLDGGEMARYEWAKKGRVPLQSLRADIDYAEKTAYTVHGTIGAKVWIYKGDVFRKM
jgi:small subunit ribosomal protein S3